MRWDAVAFELLSLLFDCLSVCLSVGQSDVLSALGGIRASSWGELASCCF